MGYEITIKDGYAHVQFTGQLAVQDLSETARRLDEADATAASVLHRLTDISGVENISIDFAAMQDFAEKRSAVKHKNQVRSAIVAKTPVQYGCARMFQMLSKQPGIKFAVFSEMGSALHWISGGSEVIQSPP
jgi:hypothetical protein